MKQDAPDPQVSCPLCRAHGENVLWHSARCRVVLVDDADHAGYCRVIWNAHVKEMTDLAAGARIYLMQAVFAAEQAVRAVMHPDKINLATLGNQVPHLHWHVIPRFVDDASFPDSIWSPPRRGGAHRNADASGLVQMLRRHLGPGK
ncbi:MAG: HIT family protein [Acidiferrobacterales bacterium]